VTWLEHGAPHISAPVEDFGFGSRPVQRCVSGQLGGTIDYDWAATGLIVTLRVNRNRLAS
jgi:two-component sensor histidine kinase